MKTTVKKFILNHLSDKMFEKLVYKLTALLGFEGYKIDSGIVGEVYSYIDSIQPHYQDDHTFEILQSIKDISKRKEGDCESVSFQDYFNKFNDTTMYWMPKRFAENYKETMEDYRTLYNSLLYKYDIPWKFISERYMVLDDFGVLVMDALKKIKAGFIKEDLSKFFDQFYDVKITKENYIEFAHSKIAQTTLGLINFIYEVLNFKGDVKISDHFQKLYDKTEIIKIINKKEMKDDYDRNVLYSDCKEHVVLFLVENRLNYITNQTKRAYEECYNVPGLTSGIEPEYRHYAYFWEQLYIDDDILAPFTFYLNEQVEIPDASHEKLQEMLEQLVMILTVHGFTAIEQAKYIVGENENFEMRIV